RRPDRRFRHLARIAPPRGRAGTRRGGADRSASPERAFGGATRPGERTSRADRRGPVRARRDSLLVARRDVLVHLGDVSRSVLPRRFRTLVLARIARRV